MPAFDLDLDTLHAKEELNVQEREKDDKGTWRPGMTRDEKLERRKWLSEGRGKKGLRIVIVTGVYGFQHIGNKS